MLQRSVGRVKHLITVCECYVLPWITRGTRAYVKGIVYFTAPYIPWPYFVGVCSERRSHTRARSQRERLALVGLHDLPFARLVRAGIQFRHRNHELPTCTSQTILCLCRQNWKIGSMIKCSPLFTTFRPFFNCLLGDALAALSSVVYRTALTITFTRTDFPLPPRTPISQR